MQDKLAIRGNNSNITTEQRENRFCAVILKNPHEKKKHELSVKQRIRSVKHLKIPKRNQKRKRRAKRKGMQR